MRLLFVTPRFGAADATPPERLAAELIRRAPRRWTTTVLTTTEAGGSRDPFSEGEFREERGRVVRFAAPDPPSGESPSAEASAGPAPPALLQDLAERQGECDLVVLFGSSPLCGEAATVSPERTVLLPFLDQEPPAAAGSEIFTRPAAFIFGSEGEEVLVLKRHQVHRRMRETISGGLLLPRSADAAAFRARHAVAGPYLIAAGPIEPGRGVEELLRFFASFSDRHPDAGLELVLCGPAALPIPDRRDIRVIRPANAGERLDAVGGALAAVIPERLAAFATSAAEPFSLGVPILVNASATALVEDCRASGGGLYYQSFDEFELILELALRDAALFPRMGAAGRAFLQSQHDWSRVVERYDRAFRSFSRPAREAAGGAPKLRQTPETPEPPAEVPSAPAEVEVATEVPGDSGETPDEPAAPVAPESGEAPATAEEDAATEDDRGDALAEEPGAGESGAAGVEEAAPEEAASGEAAPEEESGGDGLPGFFRSSIRD